MQTASDEKRTREAVAVSRQTVGHPESQIQAILLPAPLRMAFGSNAGSGNLRQSRFIVAEHFADHPDFSIRAAQGVVDRVCHLAGNRPVSISPYYWQTTLRGISILPNAVFIEYVYSGRRMMAGKPVQGIKVSLYGKPSCYGGPWRLRLKDRRGYTTVVVQTEEELQVLLRLVSIAWQLKERRYALCDARS